MEKIFLTLSGPSGIGKGPLQDAVNRFYPDLLKTRLILYNSRLPRSGEINGIHYYFFSSEFIQSLAAKRNFLVAQVRSDLQAIDILKLNELFKSNDLVFCEIFYTFGNILQSLASESGFKTYSVFLIPTVENQNTIVNIMREKLKRRGTDNQVQIEARAQSAPIEIKASSCFTHRLLNSASEDDIEEWGELGKYQDTKGSRTIKKLNDLGPNAQWLVETFVQIATGKLLPGEYRR